MLTTLRANAWKYAAIAATLGLGFALLMQTLRLAEAQLETAHTVATLQTEERRLPGSRELAGSIGGRLLARFIVTIDFPGRRLLEWALLLPLAIPGYVMAFVFLGLFSFAGPAQTLARQWFGSSAWFPDVQSPGFVIVVLSLVLSLAKSAFVSVVGGSERAFWPSINPSSAAIVRSVSLSAMPARNSAA